jgi:cell division protein FtsB
MSTLALQSRFASQSLLVCQQLEQQLQAVQEEIQRLKNTLTLQEQVAAPDQDDALLPQGINSARLRRQYGEV